MTERSAASGVRTEMGPFAIVPEWVLDAEVSDRAVRLYALLWRYADRSGRSWPSRKALADRLRCSRDTVDRAIRELVEIEALAVEARQDEAGDRATNLYLLRQMRPGTRMGEETPLGMDAERGGGMDAAGNESHGEREPMERESDAELALAVRAYDPLKGERLGGRNHPWDALVEVTGSDPVVDKGQIAKALKLIRGYVVAASSPQAFDEAMNGEALITQQIRARARLYRQRWPEMELTPTALAKQWARVTAPVPGGSPASALDAAQRGLDAGREDAA